MKSPKYLSTEPPSDAEIDRQTARFRALIAKPTRERLRTLVTAYHRELERTVAAHPTVRKVACAKGCASCCVLYVSATAPELLAIAEHVAGWPAERRAALLVRLERAGAVTAGLSPAERVRVSCSCPMLEEGGVCGI